MLRSTANVVVGHFVDRGGMRMARKPSKLRRTKKAKAAAPKKVRTKARKQARQARTARPKKPRQPAQSRVKARSRVTAGQSQGRAVMATPAASDMTAAGNTAHFNVFYQSNLGQQGADLAQAILLNCERDFASLQQIFGGLTPQRMPFVVKITSGSGGASHLGCLGTTISVGGNTDGGVDFIRSLLVMEADEVFMANFGHGWNCAASPGEGLSRVIANDLYKGVEPGDFISANQWLNLEDRINYVDRADPTDINYDSIGCSVLFLNWLRFQLNHSWADIVAAGGATLANTYKNLTGRASAWADFTAFLNAHFSGSQWYDLDSDNPFPV
jgi:hypothetical protein